MHFLVYWLLEQIKKLIYCDLKNWSVVNEALSVYLKDKFASLVYFYLFALTRLYTLYLYISYQMSSSQRGIFSKTKTNKITFKIIFFFH